MVKVKTRSDTDTAEPLKKFKKNHKNKILNLKERFLAIKAYYRKPIYSKVAKKFNCDWPQIRTIIKERKDILEYYEAATAPYTTFSVEDRIFRRRGLAYLGACMYEYIQRAPNAHLDDKLLLAQASEFCYLMKIKGFLPSARWLRQFKMSYNIPSCDKQIEMTRTPPASLKSEVIMSYCKRLIELKNKNPVLEKKEEASKKPQAENVSNSEKTKTKAKDTDESESRKLRRQKINLLEKALYEFIQRSQYHRNTLLNEDLHIKVACKFNKMLEIENFTPNKNWIKHFKLHYNINTSQRMIVVNRIPPASLDLNDILSYCSEPDAETGNESPTTVTIKHEDAQMEKDESQPKILQNSTVQPETIMTLQFHNVGEVDIKPDVSDIEFQIIEDDERPNLKIQQIEPMHVRKIALEQSADTSTGHCSDEEDIKPDITDIKFELMEDDEEVEQLTLKNQKTESMPVEKNTNTTTSQQSSINSDRCSDEEEIKPDSSDIELGLIHDDNDEQPALKIQKIESENTAEQLPKTSSRYYRRNNNEDPPQQEKNNSNHQSSTLVVEDLHVENLNALIEFQLQRNNYKRVRSKDREKTLPLKYQTLYAHMDTMLSRLPQEKVDRQATDQTTHSIDENRDKILITLEDQVHVIKAYDDHMSVDTIAREFNFQREEVQQIVQNRRKIMKNYGNEQTRAMSRRQDIAFLAQCMFEYIQRAQYYKNISLDNEALLDVGTRFAKLLKIKKFTAGQSWLNQFKITYNLPLSQRQIVLERTPPTSLNFKHIVMYCRRQQISKRIHQDPQTLRTNSSTTQLVYAASANEDNISVLRQHKIETLEKALYEYIQRSQYHRNRPLDEDLQIKVACELDNILKIEKFYPNKGWLKHFKLHYNINTSQRMIVVNRIPPASLDLNDILSYCGYTYERNDQKSPKTVTVEHADTLDKAEEKTLLQLEVQKPEQLLAAVEANDAIEEDIKPDVIDIKIELPQVQEQVPPMHSTSTAEEEKQKEEPGEEEEAAALQPPPLQLQNIDSLHMEDTSDDEVLPKLTKNYSDALKKLKSLEEFALLEENFRAIGLISQLENIFKNPPLRSN